MHAKRIFAVLLFCLSLAPLTSAYALTKDDAGNFANNLGKQALTVITDKVMTKDAKQAKLETLFADNVDIDWIGKFVLGRFWRDSTDAQKAQYLTNYKTFLIKHYTSNLAEFTDANFQVVKSVPDEQGGFIVTMHLQRPNAEDTVVDYTLRENAGMFKVYDINVEGVSMITTQRSEFASVASEKGLDYLIAQLAIRSQKEEAEDHALGASQ